MSRLDTFAIVVVAGVLLLTAAVGFAVTTTVAAWFTPAGDSGQVAAPAPGYAATPSAINPVGGANPAPSTSTPAATVTPAPTNTPEPTDTPAPPPTNTPVPPPPAPPAPPVPPARPTPTNTSKTLYQAGETVTQNGASLRPSEPNVDRGSLLNPRATLAVPFTFTNDTGEDLTFTSRAGDFWIEANGERIAATSMNATSFSVPAGGRRSFTVVWTMGIADAARFANVKEGVMVANRFSVIQNARWFARVG